MGGVRARGPNGLSGQGPFSGRGLGAMGSDRPQGF